MATFKGIAALVTRPDMNVAALVTDWELASEVPVGAIAAEARQYSKGEKALKCLLILTILVVLSFTAFVIFAALRLPEALGGSVVAYGVMTVVVVALGFKLMGGDLCGKQKHLHGFYGDVEELEEIWGEPLEEIIRNESRSVEANEKLLALAGELSRLRREDAELPFEREETGQATQDFKRVYAVFSKFGLGRPDPRAYFPKPQPEPSV